MNITHLKYAVEVEKTGSITKAADHLFMGQPNLSKAIRELEESIGLTIFKRTSRGVMPTGKGEKFLSYAKAILIQIEQMEALYQSQEKQKELCFSISVPRASYITYAFTRFMQTIDLDQGIKINFKETNSIEAIGNILEYDYGLGIIRYPLAKQESLSLEDLHPYIEIVHGDLTTMTLKDADVQKDARERQTQKHILVYERGSQFDLLHEVPTTYMWVSPLPAEMLERYGLIQRKCGGIEHKNKDVLIYPKYYKLSGLEENFLSALEQVKVKLIDESLKIH